MQPDEPDRSAELVAATDETVWWSLVAQAARERADRERVRLDALMAAHRSLVQEATQGRGVVRRTGGKPAAAVTDLGALLAWTKAKRPEMTEVVLRGAWVDFVKRLTVESGGLPADPETGERIPGVDLIESTRSIRVECTDTARNDARAFLAGLRRLDEESEHDRR